MVTLGMVISGILLALAGAKAGKKRRRATKNEELGIQLQNAATSGEIQKGKKLIDAANKDKDDAIKADEAVALQLENLGKANESLDAIATRFNSKRLRDTAK